MSVSQFNVCGICKQEIDLDSQQNGSINCNECDSPYHKSHLEIWLRLDSDCPVCRKDMQKLAFVNYSIKYDRIDVSGDLYRQLEEIFPKGIPKLILEKYIREFPERIPSEKLMIIKEKSSLTKESPNESLKVDVKYQSDEFKKAVLNFIRSVFFVFGVVFFSSLVIFFDDESRKIGYFDELSNWMRLVISTLMVILLVFITLKMSLKIYARRGREI